MRRSNIGSWLRDCLSSLEIKSIMLNLLPDGKVTNHQSLITSHQYTKTQIKIKTKNLNLRLNLNLILNLNLNLSNEIRIIYRNACVAEST